MCLDHDDFIGSDFNDLIEVEPTHAVFDRYGYDPASTPLDKLFANQALGFDMAGAMG